MSCLHLAGEGRRAHALVTRKPCAFNNTPREEMEMPFPKPLTTPPVTTTYFMAAQRVPMRAEQLLEQARQVQGEGMLHARSSEWAEGRAHDDLAG